MYKVFLNEKKIIFTPNRNITLNKTAQFFTKNSSVEELWKWFISFSRNDQHEIVLFHPDTETLFNQFISCFTNIDAAGGVVKRSEKLLFILRNGIWDLPKGKIDKGESIEVAAIREVEEECGITGVRIVKQLPSTYHIYQSPFSKNRDTWVLKKTYWFEMKYTGDFDGSPQKEENITQVQWFEKKGLPKILENTYQNLKELVFLYLD